MSLISRDLKTRHLQKNNKDHKQEKKKMLSYLTIKKMRILEMENKKEEEQL
jgi:hypothetical protein